MTLTSIMVTKHSRGSWGNAKTFEFGHKKMGKETLGIIADGGFWKPE